jgi:hypothetical protein
MKFLVTLAVLEAALLLPAPLWARLNLPQTTAGSQLSSVAAAAARDFFKTPGHAGPLSEKLAHELAESLPPEFASACRGMIEHWGAEARGTEFWSVRILAPEAGKIWLAFRCGSGLPVYAESYDERLAVLDLSAGSLAFVPLGSDAENDSTLYHLRFNRVLPLPNASGIALAVNTSTDNPCCDGGDQVTEERLVVLMSESRGLRQVLNVIRERHDYIHDDEDGDSEVIYKASLAFEPESEGRIVSVTARYREETKAYNLDGQLRNQQPAPRVGEEVFRWDTTSGRFVKAPRQEKK